MLNGQIITLKKGFQYKVLKSLVKNGQADIWEVKQLDNQQHYALKIINRHQFGHIEKIDLLIEYAQAEIDFLSSLNNSIQHHIAPCLDAGLVDQVGYRLPSLLMPLVLYQQDNFAALSKKIYSKQVMLTGEQWLAWFKQLMSALQHIQHLSTDENPLIHRNIQPKNCLLDAEYQLFLTDFGMVQKSRDNHNVFIDTFDYCAPEQLLAKSSAKKDHAFFNITPAVDIYAAAVVMYELVAGKTHAQEMLNSLTTEDQLGKIGSLDKEEVVYLQAQLVTLFSATNTSSKTAVTSSTQLVHLLQTMLAPWPKDRPDVAKILEQLDLVTADLQPASHRTEAIVNIPPTTKTHKEKNERTNERKQSHQPKQNKVLAVKEQAIQIVEKESYYFSGEWHLDALVEMNIIGNHDAVLTLQSEAAVIGDIKCHTLYIKENATVTGNIYADTIHADGKIVGDVYADTLIVGSKSKTAIKGDVKSFNLFLNGSIKGEIYALDTLQLFSHAATTGGDIYFQQLEMEEGASVNGQLIKYTDTEDDSDNLPLTEQLLNKYLERDKIHAVDTATHYFSAEYMIDSPIKMHFIGNDNASLIIKDGGAVIGDISCYSLYIKQGAMVTGTIQCSRVNSDGKVIGDIYAHTLVVGSPNEMDQATLPMINGEVKCDQLHLNGIINGDVRVVEQTVLLEQTKIIGKLYYKDLERKNGAEISDLLMIDETAEHTALRDELNNKIPTTPVIIKNTDAQTSSGLSVLWIIVIFVITLIVLFLF